MADFFKIFSEIVRRSILASETLFKLYQICELVRRLPGSVAECGVYHGGSLRMIARTLPYKKVWGFDTFTGIPAELTSEVDKHKAGDFDDTSLEIVSDFLSDLPNVELVQGIFPDTFSTIPEQEKFCLVHLDCDQYGSYIAALNFFIPRLVDGGVMIFDDYSHLEGAKKAVDEILPDIEKPPYAVRKVNGEFESIVLGKMV